MPLCDPDLVNDSLYLEDCNFWHVFMPINVLIIMVLTFCSDIPIINNVVSTYLKDHFNYIIIKPSI